jgi:hypothetical protein
MLGDSFIFVDFFVGEWIMIGLLISFIIALATLQNARFSHAEGASAVRTNQK